MLCSHTPSLLRQPSPTYGFFSTTKSFKKCPTVIVHYIFMDLTPSVIDRCLLFKVCGQKFTVSCMYYELCTVEGVVCSMQCALCSVQCVVFCGQFPVCSV